MPSPHSACTAFTAFSNPSRRTTTAIVKFARTLRDSDDIHLHARDGGEDPAGQPGLALHSLAHRGQQTHVAVDLDGMHVLDAPTPATAQIPTPAGDRSSSSSRTSTQKFCR